MTFQAYMDNIQAKTGNSPDDFKRLAKEKGLDNYRALITWLKSDYKLGQGHANAMAHVILETFDNSLTTDQHVDKHFTGAKAVWRQAFDNLMRQVDKFGGDVRLSPSDSYISINRGDTKIGIFHVTAKKVNIGIKLRGTPPRGRLEPSGTWNSMVTHRVQITEPREIDDQIVRWLREAYDKA
jgi:Domain of unknown function (DUF4287)/Domain of unknown function (DUF5655)